MALTASASGEPAAVKRAGQAQLVTSACATPAALSTGPVKMANVNAERAGMVNTAPLVGKRQAPKQAHICFIFINRRSIVMVVRCNWLFLQGHERSPAFPAASPNLPGHREGKSKVLIGKGFPFFPEFQMGRKGSRSDRKIHPNY